MKEAPQRYFEDVEVGTEYSMPSKTVTDTHFQQFSGLTGDTHPLHMDAEYARETDFGKRVAHGMLVATFTVLGASDMPEAEQRSLIAFLDQSSTFHAPVLIGDTVYPRLEVVDKEPQESTGVVTFASTVHNQDDELVLEGELRYLMARRP